MWSAFAGGLAFHAKLLAFWVILPFALLAAGWWIWQRRQAPERTPALSWQLLLGASLAFCVPLTPLLLFNWQTGGTLQRVTGNLQQSYYGVDNLDLLHNLTIRSGQLVQTIRGDHLWYLGGLYANPVAPWIAGLVVAVGLWRDWRRVAPPLLLLALAMLCSLFTVSDLFITHYALLHPLAIAIVALSLAALASPRRADAQPWSTGALRAVVAAAWPTTPTPAIIWPIICNTEDWVHRLPSTGALPRRCAI